MYENEKRKLIAGAYEMPSYSFDKIINREYSKIETEEELFSETAIECKNKGNRIFNSQYFMRYAIYAAAAILCIFIFNIKDLLIPASDKSAIYIDVNPGIKLEVNDDNNVTSIEAANKDAMEIIDEIDTDGSWEIVLSRVMYLFNEKDYLNNEKKEMLVTYCYAGQEVISEEDVENVVNDFSNNNNMQITLIYQSLADSDADYNSAKQHDVSVGKYYLLQQIKDETDVDIEELYDKNLHEIRTDLQEKSEKLKEKTHDIIPDTSPEANETVEKEPVSKDNNNKLKAKDKKNRNNNTKPKQNASNISESTQPSAQPQNTTDTVKQTSDTNNKNVSPTQAPAPVQKEAQATDDSTPTKEKVPNKVPDTQKNNDSRPARPTMVPYDEFQHSMPVNEPFDSSKNNNHNYNHNNNYDYNNNNNNNNSNSNNTDRNNNDTNKTNDWQAERWPDNSADKSNEQMNIPDIPKYNMPGNEWNNAANDNNNRYNNNLLHNDNNQQNNVWENKQQDKRKETWNYNFYQYNDECYMYEPEDNP